MQRALGVFSISIHALLAESDGDIDLTEFNKAVFLSTLSLRRATNPKIYVRDGNFISIHALLAESDRTGNVTGIHTHWISIHALLAESDLIRYRISAK